MIFKHLHLQNFKQYQELDLEFREGLTGIIGQNGSGKSSIFEAILLCLFGSANSEKEFYRSSWVDHKQAVVLELLFEISGKPYRVHREFRGKTLTHYAGLYDHKDEQIANSANAVTEEIAKLIGMDREAFTRSIFSGQKELGILSETKGEQRKLMVRKMVGLDNLDKIQNLVREDRNTQKKMIQGQAALLISADEQKELKANFKTIEKQVKHEQQQLDKLEKVFQKQDSLYHKAKLDFKVLDELYQQNNKLEMELGKYKEGLEHLSGQLADASAKQSELQGIEKQHHHQLPAVNAYLHQKQLLDKLAIEKSNHDQQINLKEKLQYIDNELVEHQKKVKKLAHVKDAGLQIKMDIEAQQQSIATLKAKLESIEKGRNATNAQLAAVESRILERQQHAETIRQLGQDASCPTCLQPLVDSYELTLAHLQQEIENYQNTEISKLEKEKEKQQEELGQHQVKLEKEEQQLGKAQAGRATLVEQFKQLQDWESAIEKLSADKAKVENEIKTLGKINFDAKEFDQLKTRVAAFEAEYLNHLRTAEKLKALPELATQIQSFNERIKKGQAMVASHTKAMKALKFSSEKYHQQKLKVEELELAKEEGRASFNTQKKVVQDTELQLINIQSKQQEQDRIKQQIKQQRKEYTELNELDTLFQSFKTYILDKVKPAISGHASQLFQQITKGRYEGIKVDGHFEFHIYENGDYYPIHRFSGGEIDLANLCLRIGISKAITELAGSGNAFNFLGFDEIFGSQDEDRRHEILKALALLEEQYRQIYIISHIDTVKEYFPNILSVRKTNSGSEVQWL